MNLFTTGKLFCFSNLIPTSSSSDFTVENRKDNILLIRMRKSQEEHNNSCYLNSNKSIQQQRTSKDNQTLLETRQRKNTCSNNQFKLTIFYFCFAALTIFAIITPAIADCGCGVRCEIYSGDVHCTRCCTATVRRSVLIENYPSERKSSNEMHNYHPEQQVNNVKPWKTLSLSRSTIFEPLKSKVKPRYSERKKSTLRSINFPSIKPEQIEEIVTEIAQIEKNDKKKIQYHRLHRLKPIYSDFTKWFYNYLKLQRQAE